MNLISAKNITKEYRDGSSSLVLALKDVTFSLEYGQDAVIMGPSGSGKSTFLQILGLLDRPTSGQLTFDGKNILKMSDHDLAKLRNKEIGFVFQSFNLQSYNTAAENVALPLLIAGVSESKAMERAKQLLERVGLSNRFDHLPNQLSGGEMQRVAIARALVAQPKLILADEPTGNLDKQNSESIMELFKQLSDKSVSFVIITHDERVAARYSNIIHLEHGELVAHKMAKQTPKSDLAKKTRPAIRKVI